MVFDGLNNYSHQEDPDDREVPELGHNKDFRPRHSLGRSSSSYKPGSVTLVTRALSVLVWCIFLAAVAFGTYYLIGLFTQN